ncbi:hypothetical protein VNI00_004594 [Paramarasmius palmivorus]|uniref:Cytochrome P450 n=1 Tax=Paramarasmius palmivorus TaxID=297713 RepID=A0AAW0DJK4_9AGAR
MEACKELLDKRSLTTADRPPSVAADLVTTGLTHGFGSICTASFAHPVLWDKRCPQHDTKEAVEIIEAESPPGKVERLDERADGEATQNTLRVPSYMEEVLNKQEEFGLTREVIGYIGTDTTTAFLQTLVLFLTVYPEVQHIAQEELDRVVGDKRAPTLEGFDNFPYIQAIVKETHRIRPVGPVGIPHVTTSVEEDTHKRFARVQRSSTIPKPSSLTDSFSPNTARRQTLTIAILGQTSSLGSAVYGYRRFILDPEPDAIRQRVCPGIHLAHSSLASNTMNLLWAFNSKPPEDPKTGEEIPIDIWGYEEGLALTPKPFDCQIIPRGDHVKNIVKREFREATETFVKYERDLAKEDKDWVGRLRMNWRFN